MEDWSAAVAFSSLCFACAIYYTATAWFGHRERMAKIERGIDPDAPSSARGPEASGFNVKIQKGINPDSPS